MTSSYGKYQLIEQVGEGGFGRVFRALDPVLKREVAIKTCSIPQADVRARFVREAEIVASLNHRHIVTVYDFGTEGGEPYIVQELLDGQDLRQVLDSGVAIDLATKVRWLRQAAEALQHAHSKGVIHRDIKPSNVRIGVDGDVRIMDFGIAKLMQAHQQLTQAGMSIGTMGYLAPEQLTGGDIDHRADIFAFGVLAYEVISGRKAFDGNSVTAVLYSIAHEEPTPLTHLVPDCPDALVHCVNLCLQKDRDRRWSSFLPVIGELDAIAASLPSQAIAGGRNAARKSDKRRSRVLPAALGIAVIAIGLTLLGVIILRADRSRVDDSQEQQSAMPERPSGSATLIGKPGLAPPPESALVDTRDRSIATLNQETGVGRPRIAPSGRSAIQEPRTATPAPVPAQPLDMRRLVVLVRADSRAVQDAITFAIASDLRKAGFAIVDNAGNETDGPATSAPKAVTSLGQTHGAGFVIFIDGTAEAVPFSGMYTGTATLTARIYTTRDGLLAGTEIGEIGSGGTPGKLAGSQSAATVDAVRAAASKLTSGIRRIIEAP